MFVFFLLLLKKKLRIDKRLSVPNLDNMVGVGEIEYSNVWLSSSLVLLCERPIVLKQRNILNALALVTWSQPFLGWREDLHSNVH